MNKLLLILLLVITQAASAQALKIIVPGAPGTVTDVIARVYAAGLGDLYKKPVAVINRPGAAGIPGALAAARADDDTILLGSSTSLVLNKLVYKKLPYDPDTELTPVFSVGWFTNVVAVGQNVPVNDLRELISYIKMKPNKLSIGVSNMNNLPHIALNAFARTVGGEIYFIPYTGQSTSNGILDVVAGRIDGFIDGEAFVRAHVEAGKMKVVAAATRKRIEKYPSTQALSEVIPGFHGAGWMVITAPAVMTEDQLRKLNRDAQIVNMMATVSNRLDALGIVDRGGDLSHARRVLSEERATWQKQITAAGIQPE